MIISGYLQRWSEKVGIRKKKNEALPHNSLYGEIANEFGIVIVKMQIKHILMPISAENALLM